MGMVDIHNHIVYGVDDGSPDLGTSLKMGEEAARDGIEQIVCTPHSSEEYSYPKETILERWTELRERLKGVVELSLGCDFQMSADNIFAALKEPGSYSVNGNGYLLVEFSNNAIGQPMFDAVYRLQSAGYKIIVTHPERYPAVEQNPELVAEWIRKDCLIQVTANALYGRCGRGPERLANELLRRNWIHILATDAHRVDWRPPHMKRAYTYVTKIAGEETAARLCVRNPGAVVAGKALPEQPTPEGLWERKPIRFDRHRTASKKDSSHSKSIFARIFGR